MASTDFSVRQKKRGCVLLLTWLVFVKYIDLKLVCKRDKISDTMCYAPALRVPVFPVVHASVCCSFFFEHIFVIGFLLFLGSLGGLLLGLSVECIINLHIGELLERHRGQVEVRLEHLILVLLCEIYSVVDVVVLDGDSLHVLRKTTTWVTVL